MALSTFLTKVLGGSSGKSTCSPGKVKGEPYTASETERPVSSFGVALKPKRTREMREPVQIEDVNWEPLSDVRTAGPPNLDIQVEMIEPSCGSNQTW